MTAHVLFVCTGNVCRSPAAERLLRAGLSGAEVGVSSAGTHALVGDPMTEPMARLVAAHGADADGFRARQLGPALVREADLVLALTGRHRSAVVAMHPPAVQRTFVLGELAQMLAGVEPGAEVDGAGAGDRLQALVALAKRRRTPGIDPADDVPDPYGGTDEEYAISFGQIVRHLEPVTRLLAGRG